MANSFFNGTDADLRNGSKNFAALISSSPKNSISAELAASYQVLSDSYLAAYQTVQVPSMRTTSATAAKNSAKILLRAAASDLAKIINGTSTVTDEQRLGLGLNVRATPSPIGPPGTPFRFAAALRPDGALRLTWKCNNPAGAKGVIYQVYRVIGSGDLVYLGGAGRRKFIDSTVPAGTPSIIYRLQATRTRAVGVSADFLVKFGSESGGAMAVSTVEKSQKPTKIAA